jgi:uncharacterized protein YqjF (DUF2071 family)
MSRGIVVVTTVAEDGYAGPSVYRAGVTDPYPIERPRPVARPLMRQRWETLALLHWPVDPAVVQRRLPDGLTADTFDGSGWVALVPFRMKGIGLRRGPAVPYFGSFFETNVRTYVRGPDGRPGVWFDSLDIDRALPVAFARLGYGLPYQWAKMDIRRKGDRITYEARRRRPHRQQPSSRVTIEVGDALAPGALTSRDRFFTSRWRLYSPWRSRVVVAGVEHPPWPLHRAEAVAVDDELIPAAGYPVPAGSPHVLYSPGIPVVAGRPVLV